MEGELSMSNYNFKNKETYQLEATTTQDEFTVNFVKVTSIWNRGNEDLLVCYDKTFDDAGNNYEIIPAGINVRNEINEEVYCGTLYFKTLSGTTSFQLSGFEDYAPHK